MNFICTVCNKSHSMLETLHPDCLAAVKIISEEEIKAALEKGRKEYEASILAKATMPGYYR